MSKSLAVVSSPKFWSALALSMTLHVAVSAGLIWLPRLEAAPRLATSCATVDFAQVDVGTVRAPRLPLLPVEVESEALPPVRAERVRAERVRAERVRAEPLSAREAAAETGRGAIAAKQASTENLNVTAAPSAAGIETKSSSDVGPGATAEQSVDRATLHQAMAAAATAVSSPGNSTFTQPVVRVDPQEKNLDRALARAFAWAFAVDRSLFLTAPVGRASFVVELAEDGKIARILWAKPRAPDRLKQLVQRMAKLLSVNRFSVPPSVGDVSLRRAYAMTVTESHVAVPAEATRFDGQAGDIWILGAGETPTIGHPSHPYVGDVTGHRLDGELDIVVPLPDTE